MITVTLSARGEDEAAVEALLAPAAEHLLTQIAAAGYGVSAEPADTDRGRRRPGPVSRDGPR